MALKIPENLLLSFFNLIKKIGIAKAERLIITASNNDIDSLIKIQIIINSICYHFQITEERLRNEKTKSQDFRKDATAIFCFLLSHYFNYKYESCHKFIKISKTVYYTHIDYIKNLDNKIKFQRDLLLKLETIKKEIEINFKNYDENSR